MTTVLLVDDSAHACELFADAIRQRLEYDVITLRSPSEVTAELVQAEQIDVAVVDLSFPGDELTGADVLLQLHLDTPSTRLIILTDGDAWAADLLRDSWEVLPIACALSKSSPVSVQLDAVRCVVEEGEAPIDPVLQPLLPAVKSPWRTLDGFSRLVQHRGHAKLWQAVLACGPTAEYQDLAQYSGLRLNALRNYRAQLLPELGLHGLYNPPMRDLYMFVMRCRPFLAPFVEAKGLTLRAERSDG